VAVRTKTIEYAWPTITSSLASATWSFPLNITIQIPETVVLFRAVTMLVHARDDGGAAANMTSCDVELTLVPAAGTPFTVTTTITNSGEHQTYEFTRDVTSYFVTNWSGTSKTASFRVRCNGLATANHSAKILITYDYDDDPAVNPTQAKTVRFPIESTLALLTTSLQNVGGGGEIPPLLGVSSVLPEASVTVDEAFVELWCNEGMPNSTTNFALETELGGVPASAAETYRTNAALISSCWNRMVRKLNVVAPAFESAINLRARATGITSRYEQLCGWVVVTYRFDASATTRVLNSLVLPLADTPGSGQSSTEPHRFVVPFWVQEPGSVTLGRSACFFFEKDAAATTGRVSVGGQSFRTFTMVNHSLTCGQGSFAQRFDSGGSSGLGHTLTRGLNNLAVRWNFSAAGQGYSVSGFVCLNYESDAYAGGLGSHNQSIHHLVHQFGAAALLRAELGVRALGFAGDYFLNGLLLHLCWIDSTPLATGGCSLEVGYASGENVGGTGEGWVAAGTVTLSQDVENAVNYLCCEAGWMYRPWESANAPVISELMNVKTNRRYAVTNPDSVWSTTWAWVTVHNIQFTVAGSVTGYSGDGSGIEVRAHDKDTGQLLATATTAVGGAYSMVVFDNTRDIFCEARQSATLVGRSDDAKAV
jgi:hypothetical protein